MYCNELQGSNGKRKKLHINSNSNSFKKNIINILLKKSNVFIYTNDAEIAGMLTFIIPKAITSRTLEL